MELNRKNALLMAAAMTGLVAGTAARSQAAPVTGNAQAQVTTRQASPTMGKIAIATPAFATEDKHSCKGKNDCKGQGGCKG